MFALADAIGTVHAAMRAGFTFDESITRGERLFAALHPGDRAFAEHALEQYLDLHEAREAQVGELRFMGVRKFAPSKRRGELAVWGPMYESPSGLREVRRLRMGRAKKNQTPWMHFAAWVATHTGGHYEANEVIVLEVGLLDGIEEPIGSFSATEVKNNYETTIKDHAIRLASGTLALPGRNCTGCKLLRCCTEIGRADGALQQGHEGYATRSVSAQDLKEYEECPSKWHMNSVHLPAERSGSDAITRGKDIHKWLEVAHSRRIACSHDDLADLPNTMRTSGVLGPSEFQVVAPYLVNHVEVCPLRIPGTEVVAIEKTFYALDSSSDTVIVNKPDMVLHRNDKVIHHEVKTTTNPLPLDSDDARMRFLTIDVNYLLLQAASKTKKDFEVHLEVLTPHSAGVYVFTSEDADLAVMIKSRVRNLSREWLQDMEWQPKTGPHCGWCEVRRWCPEKDTYASSQAANENDADTARDTTPF